MISPSLALALVHQQRFSGRKWRPLVLRGELGPPEITHFVHFGRGGRAGTPEFTRAPARGGAAGGRKSVQFRPPRTPRFE